MIDSRDVIKHSSSQDEWESFSNKIEMLTERELTDLADRLSVESDANWDNYRDEFARQTWRDFTYAYAYEKVNGGTY